MHPSNSTPGRRQSGNRWLARRRAAIALGVQVATPHKVRVRAVAVPHDERDGRRLDGDAARSAHGRSGELRVVPDANGAVLCRVHADRRGDDPLRRSPSRRRQARHALDFGSSPLPGAGHRLHQARSSAPSGHSDNGLSCPVPVVDWLRTRQPFGTRGGRGSLSCERVPPVVTPSLPRCRCRQNG